jgi:hypothetical protein
MSAGHRRQQPSVRSCVVSISSAGPTPLFETTLEFASRTFIPRIRRKQLSFRDGIQTRTRPP